MLVRADDTGPFCELPYRCLTKLLENVNPEIDRNGYHRYNNDQDDEQRRYLCSSAPDNIKNNRICDGNDDGSDNKTSTKTLTMVLLHMLQSSYLIQNLLAQSLNR